MDKATAEQLICELVKKIDVIRVAYIGDEQVRKVAELDAEIVELKKITGQRMIVGTMHI